MVRCRMAASASPVWKVSQTRRFNSTSARLSKKTWIQVSCSKMSYLSIIPARVFTLKGKRKEILTKTSNPAISTNTTHVPGKCRYSANNRYSGWPAT